MAEAPVRIGIVGAHPERGWAQAAHLPALRHLPEFELAAVATTRQESAEATARRHGVPHAYADWRRMIAEAELDAVIVAVKVPFHREIVLDAIRAGRHVFCEWPLGLDAAEAADMHAAASTAGVRHMVGLQSHAHPVLIQARDLVEDGAIGRIISCTLTASLNNWGPVLPAGEAYRMDARFGATGLTVPGGHTLDALCACLGGFAELSAVVATPQPVATLTPGNERIPVTAPTQLLVAGRLRSGAVASLHVKADIHAPTGLRFEINGTAGDLVVTTAPPIGNAPVGIQRAVLRLEAALQGSREFAAVPPADPAPLPDGMPGGAPAFTARLLRRFAAAIRSGRDATPHFATALDRHRLIEAVAEASRSGRRVTLADKD
ncbi:Gfo/Idh/MocA family protein [Falsiroseomonas oryzae]|uniref:Gfo/Idh/MocA family protein n=1 Tax=Falsiroseomonas oryzae TaxID=2766473 RepID=UPI0022EAA5BD|nr:Gfo/Idh/MocA family oxidoreductase [Roseomonas sp. MO-31]